MTLPSGFSFYDTTGFSGKPNLSGYGIAAAWIQYEGGVLPTGTDSQLHAFFAQLAINHPNVPWILNIEFYSIAPGNVVDATNVNRLIHILQIAKSESNGQPVSLYGLLPDYTHGTASAINDDDPNILALAAEQDFFAMDCYARVGSTQITWQARQDALLARAAAMVPGKPIYFYLWMYYTTVGYNDAGVILDGVNDGTILIEDDFWRFQLEYTAQVANSAIIWGGYDLQSEHPLSSPLPWNPNASWFSILNDVINGRDYFRGNTLLTITGCV